MRVLVVIAADHYVRNLVEPGAFDALHGEDLRYVASRTGVVHEAARERLARTGRPVTYVGESARRQRVYANLQLLVMWTLRRRSRTMRIKSRLMPRWQRARFGVAALPGLRAIVKASYLRRTGLHPELHALLREVRPDVVVAPSSGTDALVTDAVRAARDLGIPSVVVAHNWDNLSSKGAFAVVPDAVAVWGEQSARHAVQIHGLPRERVAVVGSPALDPYFRHRRGSSAAPFEFEYVLFAGCFAPFDERAALRRLDALVASHGLDLTIVYRPHPHRQPRRTPDRIAAGELRHVVLDPGVRELYDASFHEPARGRAKPLFPPLDEYPALLEHARFVISPLSTMVVEAAIFERPVIVVAYDDGIHPNSPDVVATFDHFDGIRDIAGLHVADTPAALDRAFLALAAGGGGGGPSLRDQVGDWLHHDDSTYAERLAAVVRAQAGRGERLGAAADVGVLGERDPVEP